MVENHQGNSKSPARKWISQAIMVEMVSQVQVQVARRESISPTLWKLVMELLPVRKLSWIGAAKTWKTSMGPDMLQR